MNRSNPIWEIFKVVVAVFVVAIIIRYFVFQPFIVDGSSMEPNFHNNEYIIVQKISYYVSTPHRGDVVVLKYPNDTSIDYIKRIIGLPGETIKILNGNVYINGKLLNEPYLTAGQKTTIDGSLTVPYQVTLESGQYFVMGDNRDHSADSREGWVLPKDDIIGRASIVLYPTQDFHSVSAIKYSN